METKKKLSSINTNQTDQLMCVLVVTYCSHANDLAEITHTRRLNKHDTSGCARPFYLARDDNEKLRVLRGRVDPATWSWLLPRA